MKILVLLSLLFSLPAFASSSNATLSADEASLQMLRHDLPQNPDNPPPYPDPNNPPSYDHYYTYNFGRVPINTTRSTYLRLNSTGPGNLFLYSINISGAGFYAQANCSQVLPPGASCLVYVQFSPWYVGRYQGQLVFATSAGNFIVNLYGTGRRY